jgi:hypothetical protein
MIRRSCFVLVLSAACARAPAPDASPPPSASMAPPDALAPLASQDAEAPATGDAALATAARGDGTDRADKTDGSVAPGETAALPAEGADFLEEARVLFRVATCGGSSDVPSRFDAAVVERHCDELRRAYADYTKSWLEVARPFIAALEPHGLPSVVVYPFGGGDLVSALATFPEASEITTVSLEPAGDVRLVDKLAPERLGRELAAHRAHLERLFEKAHSRTDNLEKGAQAELPGEIVFDLAALALHGGEPLGLRYFKLKPDGALEYVTQSDIDAQLHHPKALRALFDDVELRYRLGGDPPLRVRVLRHVAFNLDDEHLKANPALLGHLTAKGKVSAMTKAATHLLWNDHFALIRGWLIDHTDWMVSDSTGIPPRYAQPAGYVQDTYGIFDGPAPFGAPDARDANDFKRLFASQPTRELSFRYGYPDRNGHAHMIVTHR